MEMSSAPLPSGLRGSNLVHSFFRDVYYDTLDRDLDRRAVSCRLRIPMKGARSLEVKIRGTKKDGAGVVSSNVFQALLPDEDADMFDEALEPARVLRAIIDPGRLSPRIDLETDCFTRIARHRVLLYPQYDFCYDTVVARASELSETFYDISIKQLRPGGPPIERLGDAIREEHGFSLILGDRLARARALLDGLELERIGSGVRPAHEVAIVPYDDDRMGLRFHDGALTVLSGPGGGEEAARQVLKDWFGSSQAQMRLLGRTPASASHAELEVYLVRRIPTNLKMERPLEWLLPNDVVQLVGSPAIRDTRTLAALHVAARSDLIRERPVWALRAPVRPSISMDASDTFSIADLQGGEQPIVKPMVALDRFINRDFSQLAFNTRVLELAEDKRLPLLARVRFLSIFNSTMDEAFMVRVGWLKRAVSSGKSKKSIDGLNASERLDAVAIRSRRLMERAYACFRDSLIPEMESAGIRVVVWENLDESQRAYVTSCFEDRLFPALTPMAASPSHPFPHIPNFTTAIAAMVRNPETGVEHFAAVPVPDSLPRFLQLEGESSFISTVDVITQHVDTLFPGLDVILAHWFRVTRSSDVKIDEWSSQDLLQAIVEEVEKRPYGPVVRLEIDSTMPQAMRELLVQEFRFENPDQVSTLRESDLYLVGGIFDLNGLSEIAKLDRPELHYEPFTGAEPVDASITMMDAISQRDVLVHFPYDSFESTVERFFVEATDDPDVLAIKVALYRTNDDSQIVNTLARAAALGKQVTVLVELKARFEEERNAEWAKELEHSGIHVMYGLFGLKTHSKAALIARREGEDVQRYIYIGTGNLNAETAKGYTDLGLFSKHPDLCADVNDLFNVVSGNSVHPDYRRLLVAPVNMFTRFMEMIRREIDHAKAGRGGRIRIKVNGLGDPEILAALYEASQSGVQVDLVIRGICSLCPQVPGLSERIRVISTLGRFLEHSRIYHFGNAGEDEYYIGSADLRTRNLRRRVEVATPVLDPRCHRQLDEILEMQLNDPLAWELGADESYVRRNDQGIGSQDALVAALEK
jgi:polyphosphate kinase